MVLLGLNGTSGEVLKLSPYSGNKKVLGNKGLKNLMQVFYENGGSKEGSFST